MKKSSTEWTSAAEIRQKLKQRWRKGEFLSGRGDFPLRYPLRRPTAAQMLAHFDELRRWIEALNRETVASDGRLELERKEINHRQLGRNEVPTALLIPDIDSLAAFIGAERELRSYRRLYDLVSVRCPQLLSWAEEHPFELIKHGSNMEILLDLVLWLQEHPRPGIYLRQLSIPGVDTKFIETNKKILMRLLDLTLPASAVEHAAVGVRGFADRFGFLSAPQLVRFRLLDPGQALAGCRDISVPAEEFADLPPETTLPVDTVFIIENDVTALAIPPTKGAMVIFGRGYHFKHLSAADWLRAKRLFYWGDIDTHGFAILNQFRGLFPKTRSLLMDRNTLREHRERWSVERSPFMGEAEYLTNEERSLLKNLQANTWGEGVRLEQEYIPFDRVKEALNEIPMEHNG